MVLEDMSQLCLGGRIETAVRCSKLDKVVGVENEWLLLGHTPAGSNDELDRRGR